MNINYFILHYKMEERLTKIEKKLELILTILNETDSSSKTKKNTKSSKVTPTVVKSGNAMIKVYNDTIIIGGYTYSNKEVIKKIGGKWSKEHKGWKIDVNKRDELISLVNIHFESSALKEIKENLLNEEVKKSPKKSQSPMNIDDEECIIDSDSDSN